jgi:serine acetyltransferase
VLIAANSLINKDVEMNSVMMGVPAVKISDNGSIGYV